MHPFDIKQALLAKHAQHVVVIHFPIALFVVGVVFDWIGHFRGSAALRNAAYYNFAVAALSSPLAVATGILAWQWQLEAQKLSGLLLLHLVLGIASALLIVAVWWLRSRARANSSSPGYALILQGVGVFVVALTGHLGGFLSGVNAPN